MNRRRALSLLMGATAWLSCATQGPDVASGGCPSYASGMLQGKVASPMIVEASGIAASRRQSGVLWLHNDSGDGSRFYATDERGQDLGGFELAGHAAIDIEDMAVGPAPDGSGPFLFLADIGDNPEARANVSILRVPEPAIGETAPNEITRLDGAVRLVLRYPNREAHDAEAFFVDPQGGDLYIVTKREARVFRARGAALGDARKLHILEAVGRLVRPGSMLPAANRVTGADIDFERNQIVVRTYSRVLVWPVAAGESIPQALTRSPCVAPARREPQGEAVGFNHDGRAYWTISEGRHPPLYRFEAASQD